VEATLSKDCGTGVVVFIADGCRHGEFVSDGLGDGRDGGE